MKNYYENIFDLTLNFKKQLENKIKSNNLELESRTSDRSIYSQLEGKQCEIYKKRIKELQDENKRLLTEINYPHLKYFHLANQEIQIVLKFLKKKK